MKIENKYGVAVGQEWVSCDKRDKGRRVRVLEVRESNAVCRSNGNVKTRIRLDRFKENGTGWRRADPT